MTFQPPLSRNPIGAAIFWTAFAVWALHTPGRRFRTQAKTERREGRGTGIFIRLTFGVGLTLAFIAAYSVERAAFPGPWQASLSVGLILMVAGLGLAEWAARTLGRFYRPIVAIQESHQVVTAGPYRLVRHPVYAGGILALVGMGICLGNWISVGLCLVATLVGYGPRISVEERVLERALGEPYVEYERRTKRLLPGVW